LRDRTRHFTHSDIQNRIFDADGDFIYTSDIAMDIAAGRVSGVSFIDKFGETGIDIDTADGLVDVWDGVVDPNASKTYNYSVLNDIDTISSSNATDTQTIEIQGLNALYNEVTQTATLNGQSKVTLSTPLMRVFRMKNTGATNIAGDVYCYVDGTISGGVPTVANTIRAIIRSGNNQTLMALYTIPAGKTGYLLQGTTGIVSKLAGYIDGKFSIRPFGGVFQVKRTFGLSTTGTSQHSFEFPIPLPIEEKSDIRVRVQSSANNMSCSATFTLVLEDN
jgi:microcystin degradation protein MlrC